MEQFSRAQRRGSRVLFASWNRSDRAGPITICSSLRRGTPERIGSTGRLSTPVRRSAGAKGRRRVFANCARSTRLRRCRRSSLCGRGCGRCSRVMGSGAPRCFPSGRAGGHCRVCRKISGGGARSQEARVEGLPESGVRPPGEGGVDCVFAGVWMGFAGRGRLAQARRGSRRRPRYPGDGWAPPLPRTPLSLSPLRCHHPRFGRRLAPRSCRSPQRHAASTGHQRPSVRSSVKSQDLTSSAVWRVEFDRRVKSPRSRAILSRVKT